MVCVCVCVCVFVCVWLQLLQACECMCVWCLCPELGVHLVALVPAWAVVADLAPADAAVRPCVTSLSPASRPEPRLRLMDPPWCCGPPPRLPWESHASCCPFRPADAAAVAIAADHIRSCILPFVELIISVRRGHFDGFWPLSNLRRSAGQVGPPKLYGTGDR